MTTTKTKLTIKERPILFSGEMVKAILAGRKTQTRRVVKIEGDAEHKWLFSGVDETGVAVFWSKKKQGTYTRVGCPYGKIGDQLWVRETWYDDLGCRAISDRREGIFYRADGEAETQFEDYMDLRWKPSIHMPRWASRIQLENTNVWVERLNDISEANVKAEGITDGDSIWSGSYRGAYATRWNEINAKQGYSWESNPLVFVIEFKKL